MKEIGLIEQIKNCKLSDLRFIKEISLDHCMLVKRPYETKQSIFWDKVLKFGCIIIILNLIFGSLKIEYATFNGIKIITNVSESYPFGQFFFVIYLLSIFCMGIKLLFMKQNDFDREYNSEYVNFKLWIIRELKQKPKTGKQIPDDLENFINSALNDVKHSG